MICNGAEHRSKRNHQSEHISEICGGWPKEKETQLKITTHMAEKLAMTLLLKLTTLVGTATWGPARDRWHVVFTLMHTVTKQLS